MKTVLSGAAAVLLGLAIAGCTTLQGGKTIVKYEGGTVQGPIQAKAPATGTYGLFALTDVQPIVRINVNVGEELGFRKNPDGQLVAFAGDRTFPVDGSRNYYWKKM
jgi:hypothetical protein